MPDDRPSAAVLAHLAVDDWSALLATALPVVRDLPDRLVDGTVRRLAALPPGRLATGRSRDDLARVLAREEVWPLVDAALGEDAPRPWRDADAPTGEHRDGRAVDRLRQRVEHLQEREEQLDARVRSLREQVASLRRERDGAVARADAAAAREADATAARDEARAQARAAAAASADAEERIAREVARGRRRDEAEVAGLRDDLRAVRRERDELQQALTAAEAEVARLRAGAAAAAGDDTAPGGGDGGTGGDDRGGRRGRPSVLPAGIAPGTRRAAAWLVAEGRVLLVDGYNVTRTHRDDLPVAEQRRWLEEAVAALAQRRHVDATIIWDSTHGTATTRRSRRGLTVRFARADASADDEMVLHVELALDPDTPVVAVTDDVELRHRLAAHGVDLLDSTSFTWLL